MSLMLKPISEDSDNDEGMKLYAQIVKEAKQRTSSLQPPSGYKMSRRENKESFHVELEPEKKIGTSWESNGSIKFSVEAEWDAPPSISIHTSMGRLAPRYKMFRNVNEAISFLTGTLFEKAKKYASGEEAERQEKMKKERALKKNGVIFTRSDFYD